MLPERWRFEDTLPCIIVEKQKNLCVFFKYFLSSDVIRHLMQKIRWSKYLNLDNVNLSPASQVYIEPEFPDRKLKQRYLSRTYTFFLFPLPSPRYEMTQFLWYLQINVQINIHCSKTQEALSIL